MKNEVITFNDSKSPISEIFKTLRTNIQFMSSNKTLKTILVTSTVPGEGKSYVSVNLATTFAQTGKKVLLIDADMRKGRQYLILGVSPKPGLSNYLSGIDGEGPLESFIQSTPCELVTDAVILSRVCDTTVIVVEENKTKKDNLKDTIKKIKNVGGNISGVVVNKVNISASKYEQTYYYSSTSRKDDKNAEKKVETVEERQEEKENSSNEEDNIMQQVEDYLKKNKEG